MTPLIVILCLIILALLWRIHSYNHHPLETIILISPYLSPSELGEAIDYLVSLEATIDVANEALRQ